MTITMGREGAVQGSGRDYGWVFSIPPDSDEIFVDEVVRVGDKYSLVSKPGVFIPGSTQLFSNYNLALRAGRAVVKKRFDLMLSQCKGVS